MVLANGMLAAAEVRGTGAAVEIGTPKPLFSVAADTPPAYDVSADGRRFLFNAASTSSRRLHLLTRIMPEDWTRAESRAQ